MSEELGQGTFNAEKLEEPQSPNMKIHGEPPPSSPLPGTENPDSDTVNNEVNPNTE
ncbi:MAG: hypothetical protein M3416_19130 [Acidobacteriota bacterium]|nr:hypothetical protein [Acidobacteriota bacterium]